MAVLAEEQSTTVKERNESTRDEQCTLARAVRAVGRRLERIKLGYLYFKSTGGRQDLASVRKMVFLCYGNICRSAFAEHYARKVFGQRGIRVEILSRGTCAIPGKRSPDLAVEAARVFGVDLIDHEAQALDEEDLRACDMVIGMDLRNFDLFRKKFLVYRRKFFLLGHPIRGLVFGAGIRDPFGLPASEYRKVFKTIAVYVDELAYKIKESEMKKRKIKVMFVTGALSYGGLERVVINLASHMDRDVFEPIVVCMHNRGELAYEIERCGIEVIALNENHQRGRAYLGFFLLRQIIKKKGIDIIHSHNTGPLIDAVLASRFTGAKALIHTDHARRWPDKKRYIVAERIAAKFVVRVIAVSEETKQNLVRHEGIDERKIRVIINGVAKERYSVSVDRDATLKRLGIHGFDFYVGLGVVLTDQKGIIHLIRAAPTVLKAFPRTAFVIAGDGPIKNELMVEAKRVGVEKEFFFLGMRDDIPELLQILDVYVLPSEWEGLPLVILEAMAARRCVLATDVGGVSLAIKDGVNGLLIPSKDPQQIAEKLVFLLSRPELRQELGKNAYSTYEAKFSVERMVRDYEEEYLAALGR